MASTNVRHFAAATRPTEPAPPHVTEKSTNAGNMIQRPLLPYHHGDTGKNQSKILREPSQATPDRQVISSFYGPTCHTLRR